MKMTLAVAGIVFAAAMIGTPSVAMADKDNAREKSANVDPNKRVCKRVANTGSRVKQRVCHSQREWDRIREASQETLRQQRDAVGVTSGESGT